MNREEKGALLERLQSAMEARPNLLLAEYRGLTVEQFTELRTKVRRARGALQVVKNTFLRRAVSGTAREPIATLCEGPNAVVLAPDDLVDVAKVVAAADRELEAFKLKGGVVSGRLVTADQVRQLAELPPREVLLGRALGSMTSPIRGFLSVCQGNVRSLLYALEAVRKAKEKAAA